VQFSATAADLCSSRAPELRGGVNQFGETQPETQRNVTRKVWNRVVLGAPTSSTSKPRDAQRGKPLETIGLREWLDRQARSTETLQGKILAPQVGLEPTTLRLTAT
jgi:hypothetical protein